MKNILKLMALIVLLSCTTAKPVNEMPCFGFKIPPGMYDNKNDAVKYKYDNFLIENGKSFGQSAIIIAIRHVSIDKNGDLKSFVDSDQYLLSSEVSIKYDKPWDPPGFAEKNINYIAYQFNYKQQGQAVYQRSVYIKCRDVVYIISMSAKSIKELILDKNDFFWENIIARER